MRGGGKRAAEDSISAPFLLVGIGTSPDKEPNELLGRLINTKKRKKKQEQDLKY
jgi:hypothetical protein